MTFKKYVSTGKLLLPSSRQETINMRELLKFLQENPSIKHLELEDYKDLVEALRSDIYHDALKSLDKLIFDIKNGKTREAIQSLIEINRFNIELITGIKLTGANVKAADIRSLVEIPNLEQIKYLDLSYSGIGIEGVRVLAESSHLQGLKHLDLSNVKIGDNGVKLLAESLHMANLEYLGLHDCGITNTEFLARSSMTKLKHLDLDRNELILGSIEKLASFPGMPQLESLTLWDCKIADAEALDQMTNLKSLVISSFYLPEADVSPSLIEKLVERKFDYLDMGIFMIKSGVVSGGYGNHLGADNFCKLIMIAQSARDEGRVLDANVVKQMVFDIATYNNYEVVKHIVDQPDKYPFLINSRLNGNSLSHFYNHIPEMEEFLFTHGMIPEAERRDGQLQNILEDIQSVHASPVTKKINFLTAKLVESTSVNKDQLKEAADSYVANIPSLLELYRDDQVRIGLLSLTAGEKRSVMEKTLRDHEPVPGDGEFITTVANKAKKALEEKYLKKRQDGEYDQGFPSSRLQYDYTEGNEKFITIPETIGYIKLLIDKDTITLVERKELLVTLAAQNRALVEKKLPLIRSELENAEISLEQITGRSSFHSLLENASDDKIDNLFKQLSDLDIKEISREHKAFALLKQIYVAATTYGENSSACIQGTWSQIIASIDEINHELAEQCNQYLEEERLAEQRTIITEEKGRRVAESLAGELVKYPRTLLGLKDALERLVDNILDIDDPERITFDQQILLAKINTEFLKGISDETLRGILGNNYNRRIPKNDEYKIIVDGFIGNEAINTFIPKIEILVQSDKLSEQIKVLDEQGQIARNKESVKKEVKKLIEDFADNGIDINTKNSEGETLLHLAAKIGDKSLVSELLKEGASFDVQNNQRLTPVGLSRVREVSDLLISVEEAFSAASDGLPVALKQAVSDSGDAQAIVKAKNVDGHTLLSLVVSKKSGLLKVQEKRLEIIDLLIDNGAEINFKDSRGNSLLYTAVSNTDKEVVGALLRRGAVIDGATELIVEGMKALPNPNKDTKVILEQLEQHKSMDRGCVLSGGRAKRSAVSCILRADKYIEELRKLSPEDQKQLAQKMQDSTFSGSTREIKQAEKVRDLLLSDKSIDQKSYEISKLIEDPIERRILDLSEDVSQSENSKLKKRFMNAAGRIQLLRGIHGTFASCKSGGLSTDCALSVGEIGFSFFSQLIENGMLKITPRIVKSAASVAGKVPGALGKNLKFAMIARGVAGGITGVFDIVDIGMSANTLIICLRKREKGEEPCSDKEIRDSIAGITFGSISFVSGVAFTALAMTGVGTAVGLVLMVGQGIYSGVSNIIEYEEKYDTTHDENWRIFWHTFALQPIPEDVQYLAAKTEIVNKLAKEAWKRLESSPNVAAIAMGLGEIKLIPLSTSECISLYGPGFGDLTPEQLYERSRQHIGEPVLFNCANHKMNKPDISPSHASIKMNETNADTARLSRFTPQSPSSNATVLCAPKFSTHGAKNIHNRYIGYENERYEYDDTGNFLPVFESQPTAIYPCGNAFAIDVTRNDDKNQTILFDLKYVNQGEVIGSNEWRNAFLVYDGRPQIFGGNNVKNQFHLMNKDFSGRIYGGNNATNVLDLSNLNYNLLYIVNRAGDEIVKFIIGDNPYYKFFFTKVNNIIGTQFKQEVIRCSDNEMFINSKGGYSNNKKDELIDCKKAVIWPYTKATGGEGNYTFYIKTNKIYEGVGRSEIDVRGTGTLVFPDTALLKDCSRIIYSTSSNTLSFEIPLGQNKTFILDVKNYLNEDKTPKFHLIDKHGSNIVPIIKESDLKQDPIEIKSFRLNAERVFTNSKEDDVWYESISQSHGDYQVFGKVKDKKSYRIFGSSGIDVINLSEELVFAHGGSGGDVYRIDDNTGKKIIAIIDNCAEDRRLDLLVQQNLPSAANLDNDLYLYHKSDTGKLPDHGSVIKNYFKDVSCQHLMIKTDDGMFIPFSAKVNYMNSEGEIRLVPFYHASNSENAFLLPENSTEIVIDAKEGDITFYRRKNDLLLLSDNATIPLTIIAKDFYSDPSKWQTIKPYFWNNGEFSSFDLSQKADEAVSYSDKIKSDYGKTVKEYVYSGTFSGEITHNQQRLENGTLSTVTEDEKRIEVLMFKNSKNGTLTAVTKDKKRIGVLIFKDIDPSRIGLAYSNNDLIFFDKKVDHKNLTILNWTDSELEFDKKVDHKNLTTRNWNGSEDHRISRLEFDLESGPIVIQKLDRFDLSEEGIAKMQHAFNVAAVNSEIDKRLKANGEISDNFQCLITMYGLYKGSNTYKCLGFLVLEDQINFAKAYCNSQKLNEFTDKVLKNDQFASLLTQFIIKLHNNLLLNGYQREEIARCSNIVLYEQFARSIDPTGTMLRIRNITNTMNSEIQAQFSNSTTTISENSTAVPVLSSSTNSEIQTPLFTTTVSPEDSTHRHHHGNVNATAQQRNRRAADENRKKENIPSSASRPKSWINTAFDFATKGIAKLGGLIFSSSTDSLPVEHPTLSSQQDSTRNSNATTITQHIDLDGTILLLDVFIRKITGQNYIPVNQDVSLLEVQASALNIIAEFEEILNSVCDEPAIDFAEAQSNIFKAMMSGRGNEIPGILCSYLEEAKLEPEVTQKILAAFQPTKPTSSTSEGQTKHLPYLPETAYDKPQTCLNSIKVENSSVQLCRAV